MHRPFLFVFTCGHDFSQNSIGLENRYADVSMASFGTHERYDCTNLVYVSVFGATLTVFALLQLRFVSFQLSTHSKANI